MKELINSIKWEKNETLQAQIQAHLNDLTKPQGSLGRLEEFAMRYCLCKGSVDAKLNVMRLYTFAGDHGITAEGVCPYPKEVTCQMVGNMLHGGAAISVMCRNAGIDSRVVDMGVDADFADHPMLIKCKIARGTKDFLHGSAMSAEHCKQALKAGAQLAGQSGADILGVGEMGIGNSSSASALYAMLLEVLPDKTVGMGTGSAGSMLQHKIMVLKQAVKKHKSEWDGTAIDALRRVGGYEIAGITGLILGAASSRTPVVIDGFIASAAALVALRMCPIVKEYLFFAHASAESFHKNFLKILKRKPILELDMRLGEGTGAVLGMQIINQAMHLYHEMATFSQAKVSEKE